MRLVRVYYASKYITDNSVVCDIGCGIKAHLLKTVAEKIKIGIGIEVDRSVERNNKFELILSKFEMILPFKTEKVDHICLLAVLEHIANPEMLFTEAYRVLKKKGCLIITTPTPRSKFLLQILATLRLLSRKQIADHKNYYGKIELVQLLNACGFKKIIYKHFQLKYNSLVVAYK
jgi:ubiquinone/menaquinone biosynthesis C-methylase UbiE